MDQKDTVYVFVINNILTGTGSSITNISDLFNGINLPLLINQLSNQKIENINPAPKNAIEKSSNNRKSIEFLTKLYPGTKFPNVMDLKSDISKQYLFLNSILDLLFIKKTNQELIATSNQYLTQKYNLTIRNLKSSWSNGKAFLALLEIATQGNFKYDSTFVYNFDFIKEAFIKSDIPFILNDDILSKHIDEECIKLQLKYILDAIENPKKIKSSTVEKSETQQIHENLPTSKIEKQQKDKNEKVPIKQNKNEDKSTKSISPSQKEVGSQSQNLPQNIQKIKPKKEEANEKTEVKQEIPIQETKNEEKLEVINDTYLYTASLLIKKYGETFDRYADVDTIKFVHLLEEINGEKIIGYRANAKGIQINANREIILTYLKKYHTMFQTLSFSFEKVEDQKHLIELVFEKLFVKQNNFELIKICNQYLRSYETDVKTLNASFVKPFLSMLDWITDRKIQFNPKKDDYDYNFVQKSFHVANIPLILNADDLYHTPNSKHIALQLKFVLDELIKKPIPPPSLKFSETGTDTENEAESDNESESSNYIEFFDQTINEKKNSLESKIQNTKPLKAADIADQKEFEPKATLTNASDNAEQLHSPLRDPIPTGNQQNDSINVIQQQKERRHDSEQQLKITLDNQNQVQSNKKSTTKSEDAAQTPRVRPRFPTLMPSSKPPDKSSLLRSPSETPIKLNESSNKTQISKSDVAFSINYKNQDPYLFSINYLLKPKGVMFTSYEDINGDDGSYKMKLLLETITGKVIDHLGKNSKFQKAANLKIIMDFLNNMHPIFGKVSFDLEEENDQRYLIELIFEKLFIKQDNSELIKISNKYIKHSYGIEVKTMNTSFIKGKPFLAMLDWITDRKIHFNPKEIYDYDYIQNSFRTANIPLILNEDSIFNKMNNKYNALQLKFVLDELIKKPIPPPSLKFSETGADTENESENEAESDNESESSNYIEFLDEAINESNNPTNTIKTDDKTEMDNENDIQNIPQHDSKARIQTKSNIPIQAKQINQQIDEIQKKEQKTKNISVQQEIKSIPSNTKSTVKTADQKMQTPTKAIKVKYVNPIIKFVNRYVKLEFITELGNGTTLPELLIKMTEKESELKKFDVKRYNVQLRKPTYSQRLDNIKESLRYLGEMDESFIYNDYNLQDTDDCFIFMNQVIGTIYFKVPSSKILDITNKIIQQYGLHLKDFGASCKGGKHYLALLNYLTKQQNPYDLNQNITFEIIENAFTVNKITLILNSRDIFEKVEPDFNILQTYMIIEKIAEKDPNIKKELNSRKPTPLKRKPSKSSISPQIEIQNMKRNMKIEEDERKEIQEEIKKQGEQQNGETIQKEIKGIYGLNNDDNNENKEENVEFEKMINEIRKGRIAASENRTKTIDDYYNKYCESNPISKTNLINPFDFEPLQKQWLNGEDETIDTQTDDKSEFVVVVDLTPNSPISFDLCYCLSDEKINKINPNPGFSYLWNCGSIKSILNNGNYGCEKTIKNEQIRNENANIRIISINYFDLDDKGTGKAIDEKFRKNSEKFVATLWINAIALIIHTTEKQVKSTREFIERVLRFRDMIKPKESKAKPHLFILHSNDVFNEKIMDENHIDYYNDQAKKNNMFVNFERKSGKTVPKDFNLEVNFCANQFNFMNKDKPLKHQVIYFHSLINKLLPIINRNTDIISYPGFKKRVLDKYDVLLKIPDKWFVETLKEDFDENKVIKNEFLSILNENSPKYPDKKLNELIKVVMSIMKDYRYDSLFSINEVLNKIAKERIHDYIHPRIVEVFKDLDIKAQKSREEIKNTKNNLITLPTLLLDNYEKNDSRKIILKKELFEIIKKKYPNLYPRYVLLDPDIKQKFKELIKKDKEEIKNIISEQNKNEAKGKEKETKPARDAFNNDSVKYVLRETMNMREVTVEIESTDIKKLESDFKPDY